MHEFDKVCSERYAGGDNGSWSVSEMIQSQLLTTLDHQVVQLSGDDGQPFTVDCQRLSIGSCVDHRNFGFVDQGLVHFTRKPACSQQEAGALRLP